MVISQLFEQISNESLPRAFPSGALKSLGILNRPALCPSTNWEMIFISRFRQGSGGLIFSIAILTTKEKLLSLQGNNIRLAFGNITLTEWVLD